MAGYSTYKRKSTPSWRINQNIYATSLRVIGQDGKQLGVLSKSEALAKADELGLDLVEIAPSAKPPVAKIIDFAKFKYQEEKRDREAKLKERRGSELKEIWFTPFMADNDYQVRLERVKEFLGGGHKVRIAVRFKGRQMGSKQFGYQIADRVVKDTKGSAVVDQEPKFIGRQLLMGLSPFKKAAKSIDKLPEGNPAPDAGAIQTKNEEKQESKGEDNQVSQEAN
ncbi:MAG: translation initiation factor IF-3 [bacterium]|nr:translation initiation factor IF-3 [bacterium]